MPAPSRVTAFVWKTSDVRVRPVRVDCQAKRTGRNGPADHRPRLVAAAIGLLMLTPLLVSAPRLAHAQPAPLAHWAFESDCADSSGNGFDCGFVNNPGFDVGQIGQAVVLNGFNQSVSVSSLPATSGDWSVVTWIYPTAFGDREIFSRNRSNRELRIEGETLRGCYVLSTSNACLSEGTLILDEWQMVALTFDSVLKELCLYVNGAQTGCTNGAGSPGSASDTTTIGRRSNGNRHFAGRIDEARWWHIGLFPQDIADIYNDESLTGCEYQKQRDWADVTTTPETRCYDSDGLASAFATLPSVSSWIMLVDGAEVSSSDADTKFVGASFSKTLVAIGVMFCIDEGLCTLTPALDDLLNHRAGGNNQLTGDTCPGVPNGAAAGSWSYSSCSFELAAQEVESATAQDFEAYLAGKLERLDVSIDWDGNFNRGVDAELSVRDAAKILLMLARGGEWQGKALLDPVLIDEFTGGPCNANVPHLFPDAYSIGGVEPPYFYCRGFWLGNAHDLAPNGFGGQGAVSDSGFVGRVLGADTIVVTAGPDARPTPGDQNSMDGQPYAEIEAARTGRGRN